jgi:hypothetical protein
VPPSWRSLPTTRWAPDDGADRYVPATVAGHARGWPIVTGRETGLGSRPLGVREPVDVPGLPVPVVGAHWLVWRRGPDVGRASSRTRCKAPVMSGRPSERLRGPRAPYDHRVPGAVKCPARNTESNIPRVVALVTGRFHPDPRGRPEPPPPGVPRVQGKAAAWRDGAVLRSRPTVVAVAAGPLGNSPWWQG